MKTNDRAAGAIAKCIMGCYEVEFVKEQRFVEAVKLIKAELDRAQIKGLMKAHGLVRGMPSKQNPDVFEFKQQAQQIINKTATELTK